MSFCEHCEGQRYDRAQVLRVLREAQRKLRTQGGAPAADKALQKAIEAVRALEIPHLEYVDEVVEGQIVH